MGRIKHDDLVAGVTGLEVHGKKLRITFTYKRVRCREVLDIPITKANIKFAANKLAAIKHEIALGNFDYAKHFPNSNALSRFGGHSRTHVTLGEAIEAFITASGQTVGLSTKRSRLNAFRRMTLHFGNGVLISTLLPMHIEQFRNDLLTDCQPNSVKTYLGHIGKFLRWANRNELIERELNASFGKITLPQSEKSADPFEHWEFQKMLAVASSKQFRNIMLILAYTGIRPGELRGLSWGDVDFDQKVIHIRRNITQGKLQFKLPKTNRERTVHLMPPALEALREQFTLTGNKMETEIDMHMPGGMILRHALRPVFVPTKLVPGRPPFYSHVFLVEPWRKIMKKSGVRYRRAYQLRHTFASWNITAHGNLAFIAEQMGHKSVRMLQEVYGKWIESASRNEVDSIWQAMQKNGHLPQ